MERKQLESLIVKYLKLSEEAEMKGDSDKAARYEHFADDLEYNIDIYEDDYYETEEELLESYRNIYGESLNSIIDEYFEEYYGEDN